ncbi:MAG TPA: glycosyltransferase family 87 protein [Anaerolineales bacterium]|nr:glycosyltransferase family 87 protein [Anaerolineales bacterium]
MKNKFPVLLISFGAVVAILSILADYIGLGQKGGIPALQVIAAEVGVLIVLLGMWFVIRERNDQSASSGFWRGLRDKILDQPTFTWVVLGFLIAYFAFFIFPTFLNQDNQFHYSTGYLPPREHIGFDTRLTLDHIRVWFMGEREPKYIFPALTTILFTPLLLLRYPADFYVVTAVTLTSYLILNLFLPLMILKKENRLLLFFVFAVSIFSYGLQFELETGQFYTTAMMLTVAAVYIFHKHPSYRVLAYILFSISIQLKVFPAIFVVMFVDDWRDWRGIIKRFAALGLANFALLFLLGYSYFALFLTHLIDSGAASELAYNHSIYAFVTDLPAPGWVGSLLYLYFFICFILVLRKVYLQNEKGIHADLLMTCLLGGLMIPAISHDYNLPLLATPFVLVMSTQNVRDVTWVKLLSILLITATAFAYSATLFPSNAKPVYLENSFPFLFVILTAVVLLGFMQRPINHEGQNAVF